MNLLNRDRNQQNKTERWEKKFDKKFGVQMIGGISKSALGWFPYVPSPVIIKKFIHQAILSAEENGRKKGALKAYEVFIKSIKEAREKFPNRKNFELVVDVRDIEKTLKFLSQPDQTISTTSNNKMKELYEFYVEGREKAIERYKELGITTSNPDTVFNPLNLFLESWRNMYHKEITKLTPTPKGLDKK